MNSKNIESLIAWNGWTIIWKIQDTIDQILDDEFKHRINYSKSANFYTTMKSVRRLTNLKLGEYEF